mmetsp:Transcript_8913/g.29503  ORF Transcript_8913/g.29503 Transcript_8913/m.29503 type:complete len:268 (-) Transcript_8913:97-900(-)
MAPCSAVAANGWPGREAACRRELTSSAVVLRPTQKTMSVMEALSIGTRIACPLSLPLSSGKTSATAVAEPVEVGDRLSIPERARRRSDFLGLTMSTRDWVPVRLCTVVIMPFSMPSSFSTTWITGAMQLVVQEAAVQMVCAAVSLSSLTPTTTLSTDASLTGAETMTRLTPHTSRYGCSTDVFRNTPVQSITISTPFSAHGTSVSALCSEKETVRESTRISVAEVASTSWPQMPWTESYLTKYAAVSDPPMISLMCTTSTSSRIASR